MQKGHYIQDNAKEGDDPAVADQLCTAPLTRVPGQALRPACTVRLCVSLDPYIAPSRLSQAKNVFFFQ